MVYINEKGQRYDYQYCAILKNEKDDELKHYVWASEEQINHAKDILKKQKKDDFYSVPNDELKNNTNLVEIAAINEENANGLAEVLGLPLPFPNHK